MCNVYMMIITKVQTNRIKPILPRIISKNQSSFVKNRLITNNIMIAFEIFNYLNKSKSKQGYVGIKMDMEKVYDKLE